MSRKTYEVIGATPFLDHKPGETFTASLDPDLERRALGRGSIRVVTKPKPSEKESTDE